MIKKTAKKDYLGSITGRRRARPYLKWTNNVEDLRSLEIKRRRRKAVDKEESATGVKYTKAKLQVPQC